MIETRIRKFIQHHSLIRQGEKVLVAYSGGPDSTCLLILLKKIYPNVAAVYVNHQFRGKESQQEEAFVREFCSSRKIPLYVERIDWKKKPSNLEEAARKRRYRHFAKVAAENGFHKVALAHHRDDAVETFLLRFIRGSGPRGLSRMKAQRDSYIRPMLEIERKEILHYLKKNRIPYFEDTSNQDLTFTRNKIRQKLIPDLMKNFNPAFPETVLRTAQWLEEQNEVLKQLLKPYLVLFGQSLKGWILERELFLRLNPQLQKAILIAQLEQMDPNLRLSAKNLEALSIAIQKGRDLELPGFLHLKEGKKFLKKEARTGFVEIDVPSPGEYEYPTGDFILKFSSSGNKKLTGNSRVALLDAERASFPLYIRNWKSGDSFRPLGLNGSQKLSDFFINKKIPRQERKRIPLVFKDDDLIWVAGYQIHHEYRITEKTKRVLKIELK